MRILFFGSSDFAVPSLGVLMKNHEVLAVVTQPDRKQGRHLKIGQTPVKICAQENDIFVFQPNDINAPEVLGKIRDFNADLFVVVSFRQKLSKEILSMPKHGCINVHSSLLPRLRGAAPINWAVLNADKISGVSVIRMNEFMDRGDIILLKELEVNDDDALTLGNKLAILGAEALLEAVRLIESGKALYVKQDETKATLARKLKKEDGLIHWEKYSAEHIYNQVRGLIPWPCAYTYYKGAFIKILETELIKDALNVKYTPGQVIAVEKNRGIVIGALRGALLVKKLQAEGKRATRAYDFALGHHVQVGDVFGQAS